MGCAERAAAALGHFHDARVVPALAKAMGDLGDPAAVEPLGRVVKTNYEAVKALGKIKSPRPLSMMAALVTRAGFTAKNLIGQIPKNLPAA
jgi:hypothetical protein